MVCSNMYQAILVWYICDMWQIWWGRPSAGVSCDKGHLLKKISCEINNVEAQKLRHKNQVKPNNNQTPSCLITREIVTWQGLQFSNVSIDTVDGRNPAPPGMIG